jgi:hypothetical protein
VVVGADPRGAEAGAVAALAGLRASVVSGGVPCVAGTAALVLALPHFSAYDARSPADAVAPPAHGPGARAAVIRSAGPRATVFDESVTPKG